jgi:hypothetical protein
MMKKEKEPERVFFKKQFISKVFFCLIFLMLFCVPAGAIPFQVPERLVFDLNWIGIKAGTASLELQNEENNLKIISTARSAKWVSLFYTVDDRIESILSKSAPSSNIGQPVYYQLTIREGRHRRSKEVIFDYKRNKAIYTNRLKKETKEFDLPESVHDPLSGFYQLRAQTLIVGEPAYITIFDSKKVWNTEIQVLRKEKVSVPAGTFDTIVVKPLMKSEGIFIRKGEIFIWLTDDTKHIPVKMEIKVAIGSITANLIEGIY